MSYLVTVSFDLENPTSSDYQNVDAKLNALGLSEKLTGNAGKKIFLPTTTYVGEFNGSGAGSVRDDICNMVQNAFTECNVKSKIFVAVGGDWGWGMRNT